MKRKKRKMKAKKRQENKKAYLGGQPGRIK
jgi:hypothetical protein